MYSFLPVTTAAIRCEGSKTAKNLQARVGYLDHTSSEPFYGPSKHYYLCSQDRLDSVSTLSLTAQSHKQPALLHDNINSPKQLQSLMTVVENSHVMSSASTFRSTRSGNTAQQPRNLLQRPTRLGLSSLPGSFAPDHQRSRINQRRRGTS